MSWKTSKLIKIAKTVKEHNQLLGKKSERPETPQFNISTIESRRPSNEIQERQRNVSTESRRRSNEIQERQRNVSTVESRRRSNEIQERQRNVSTVESRRRSNEIKERQRNVSTARPMAPQKNSVKQMMNLPNDNSLRKLQRNLEKVADNATKKNYSNNRSNHFSKAKSDQKPTTSPRKLKTVNTEKDETKTARADDNIDFKDMPPTQYKYSQFSERMKKLNNTKCKNSREMAELKQLNRK